MNEEMDENILIMGTFALCPRTNTPILTNICLECENINEKDGQYTCRYDEKTDSDTLRIVDLITLLLEVVEGGKTHITKHELRGLLNIGDE